MKKKFLQFPTERLSFMPASDGRRIRLRRFSNVAYRSDGADPKADKKTEETDETDPENKILDADTDEVKSIKKIGRQIKAYKLMLADKADAEKFATLETAVKELKEGIDKLTADKVAKLIEDINKGNGEIQKQLIELQEAENKRKADESKTTPRTGAAMEIIKTSDVEAFVKATFADGKKTSNAAALTIKAAETFGNAVFYTGANGTQTDAFTGRYVDPTLYQRKRKKNFILDNLNIQVITVPKLLFLVKVEIGDANVTAGDPGKADWILSGAPKPKRSFRVTTGEAEAKKVAIFGTIEDKLLKDIPSLENWVGEDFMMEMREAINDGLLNNDPAINAEAPLGLKVNAIQYTATPGYDDKIAAPNYIDAIIAATALMAFNKEEAGLVAISSDIYYRIMHLKATDNKWLNNNMVYVNALNELYIAGVKVISADEEDIPSDNILVLSADLGFKIYAYGDMVFERGLNGEDFREDKTSYRGYQEFLSFIPENRENSVMYDTFANIFADITLP